MPSRLLLLSHGATIATRRASFPADEALDKEAETQVAAVGKQLLVAGSVLTSPALAARQTASALSRDVRVDPALRDLNYGLWSGRTLADVGSTDPSGLSAWLNVAAAPPGGESFDEVVRRVSSWLEAALTGRGHVLAVTHAAVIRAAIIHILGAPGQAARHLDIVPLTVTDLRNDGRRWTVRAIGRDATMNKVRS